MITAPIILSIVPKSNRLAVAVFEGPHLLYYRICTLISRGRNRLLTARALVEHFIRRYNPELLIIESPVYVQQKTARLTALNNEITATAERLNVALKFKSSIDVRSYFFPESKSNKFGLADLIIERYPELESYLDRRNTSPQQYGLFIFSAVALGLYISLNLSQTT
jgi:hypothetical protein